MAIYGQMTGNIKDDTTVPLDNEEEDIPGLSDFDKGLEQLNISIDDTLMKSFDSKERENEGPHFTLDSSPTRRNDE